MKKHIYIYILIASFLFVGCSDLLDIDAEGTIGGDVLQNTKVIEEALNGAYYSLGGFASGGSGGELLGGDFSIMATLLSYQNGNEINWSTVQAPAYADFINKSILTTNLRVQQNWMRAYEVINAVNTILSKLDKVSDGTARNRIEGEALAIRGLLYFEMIRLWAPQYGTVPNTREAIPLILEPFHSVDEIKTPTLASIGVVYDHAIQDLTQASSLLQPFGKNGTRISFYVCQAYLGRIAMQQNDYSRALNHINNVVTSGEFTLTATPGAAFNNTNNSTEDIFALQQTLANNAGDRTTGSGVTNFYSSFTESGLGILVINSTTFRPSAFTNSGFFNSPRYSPNDLRGTIDLSVTTASASNQVTTAFYKNLANNFDELVSPAKYKRPDHVLPVIRLAEMVLSRAEAIFEQNPNTIDGQALADLNSIRTRAGLVALGVDDFVDSDAFYDSLVLERKRELIYEGHLLHDLRRWRAYLGSPDIGIGSSLFTPLASRNPLRETLVLPIPQTERDAWTD